MIFQATNNKNEGNSANVQYRFHEIMNVHFLSCINIFQCPSFSNSGSFLCFLFLSFVLYQEMRKSERHGLRFSIFFASAEVIVAVISPLSKCTNMKKAEEYYVVFLLFVSIFVMPWTIYDMCFEHACLDMT